MKRGPTGVIATTLTDAMETADSILEDMKTERADNNVACSDLQSYLRETLG